MLISEQKELSRRVFPARYLPSESIPQNISLVFPTRYVLPDRKKKIIYCVLVRYLQPGSILPNSSHHVFPIGYLRPERFSPMLVTCAPRPICDALKERTILMCVFRQKVSRTSSRVMCFPPIIYHSKERTFSLYITRLTSPAKYNYLPNFSYLVELWIWLNFSYLAKHVLNVLFNHGK